MKTRLLNTPRSAFLAGALLLLTQVHPVSAQEVLYVVSTGVGIGNATPIAELDVHDLDGDNISALALTGAGGQEKTWGVASTPKGLLVITRTDSSGVEMIVRERLDANGPTLEVLGSVRGTQFQNSSARSLKTGFEMIEPGQVLAQLVALPVTAWQYKSDSAGARHVGPMAEDFQSQFGLGDGKHISTIDAQGISFAAIQGLHLRFEAQEEEIAALQQANAQLETRLAALEKSIQ